MRNSRGFGHTVLFLLGIGLVASSARGQAIESPELSALVEASWEARLEASPLFATRVGDTRYNDRLPDVSLPARERYRDRQQRELSELLEINREQLSRSDQIHYDIFRRGLEMDLAEYEFGAHLIPLTNRSGFHVEFPDLPDTVPLESRRDFENYLARLEAFGTYVDQHLDVMRVGLERGMVLPGVSLDGFERTVRPHIVENPVESLLYAPFRSSLEFLEEEDRERLTHRAREAIQEVVVPGYRRLLEFMQTEYIPGARGSIGASALPRGREFYRHRVQLFTTLDLTPEQVHQVGLDEVARIGAEMRAIPAKVEFEGDYSAFVEHLRTSPEFYPKTADELLREVAYVLKRMDGELPRLFRTLPRTPYGIRVIPEFIAPYTTTAYYMQPSGDGRRAGFYYVNTYNLRSRPLFEVEALSLHEAVPGHHLQLALQQELEGLPMFRRFTELTAFVEGWGLYAERLGLEVGFYQDPISDFGRLSYEMWRACRLVVDTGMHYLGWTRQQAIDYMLEHTALSRHNVEAEVDRYIAWPGQALGYKIGELKIRELRRWAEEKLEDRFDLREFHEVVLGSGSVPLTVLEENVQRWVTETLDSF
jgi:uncharacterized protein (DUF885 family)